VTNQGKLRTHNIILKETLRYGREKWVLSKRDTQRLEAAPMKFRGSRLGFAKLDHQGEEGKDYKFKI
jgi:hypothetical protein